MRISDWSSDVCSSDLDASTGVASQTDPLPVVLRITGPARSVMRGGKVLTTDLTGCLVNGAARGDLSSEKVYVKLARMTCAQPRSEEHTSELQSLMRISYAVFCLKTKNAHSNHHQSKSIE